MKYAAKDWEFMGCVQQDDGQIVPPPGDGWYLISTGATEDGDASVLIATWARRKATPAAAPKP